MEQLNFSKTGSFTKDGLTGVIMLVKSGEDDKGRWFDYVPGYFADSIRVEWKKASMSAVFPPDIANFIVRKGWARAMTETEVQAYNESLTPVPVKTEPVTPASGPKQEPVPAPKKETKP